MIKREELTNPTSIELDPGLDPMVSEAKPIRAHCNNCFWKGDVADLVSTPCPFCTAVGRMSPLIFVPGLAEFEAKHKPHNEAVGYDAVAEIKRLNSEATAHADELLDMRMQRDSARAEVERLKAFEQAARKGAENMGAAMSDGMENGERLEAALSVATKALESYRKRCSGCSGSGRMPFRVTDGHGAWGDIQYMDCQACEWITNALSEPAIAAEAARIRQMETDLKTANERFERHTKAVGVFLSQLYAVMIDPLADGEIKVAETTAALLETAMKDRERIRALEEVAAAARKVTNEDDSGFRHHAIKVLHQKLAALDAAVKP